MVVITNGQMGKAARRLKSDKLGSMDDDRVRAERRSKLPTCKRAVQRIIKSDNTIDDADGIQGILQNIDTTTSAGSGGLHQQYLAILARMLWKEEIYALKSFVLEYEQG